MRREDLRHVLPQIAGPLDRFVRESRVRLALLISRDGQVLSQRGFTRSLDVIHIASLGTGIHASARAMAELLDEPPFGHLHQAGRRHQIFLGSFTTPLEEVVLICVFGGDSSIGLVRLFFETLQDEVAALPVWHAARATQDAVRFEADLEGAIRHLPGLD